MPSELILCETVGTNGHNNLKISQHRCQPFRFTFTFTFLGQQAQHVSQLSSVSPQCG